MKRCSYTWRELDEEKRCPEEIWMGSDESCIFHDSSQEKDVNFFRQKLEEKLEKGDYRFRGYIFPDELHIRKKNFERDVDFTDATFQDADFSGTVFNQNADFDRVIFHKDASFNGASFHKDASFNGASFHKDASFNGVVFQLAHFYDAIFQSVDFSRATFRDNVDFARAIFRHDVHFNGTIFQASAMFGSTFHKSAFFEEAIFQAKTAFTGDAFHNDAYFIRTAFNGLTIFLNATFHGIAYFSEATFDSSGFINITFHDLTVFTGSVFKKDIRFMGSVFQDVSFHSAIVERNFEFTASKIRELDLRNAQFLFKGHVTTDLSKTGFHRCEFENVAFVDCKWPEKIYEEILKNDGNVKLTYKELEAIYRNLKQNMQRHGDYSKAGDFYYREMECRKKTMRKKRFSLDWFKSFGYSLLKYTCGYGEKPERTALSSILTISTFALLYWVFECLQYPVQNLTLLHQIKYTVYFSFVTFTTLGLGDIHPVNDWGILLICLEAVTGAFLIALFVVVFARKMMR